MKIIERELLLLMIKKILMKLIKLVIILYEKKTYQKKNINDIGNVFNDIDYENECTLGKKKREDKIDIYASLAPKK